MVRSGKSVAILATCTVMNPGPGVDRERGGNVETHPQSLLIAEDHQVLRDRLARAFRDRGYEVRVASNYDEAVVLAQDESPEFAVVDMRMPGKSGLELLRELKRIDPATKVVMMTGFCSIATAVEAMPLRSSDFVPKP